MSLFTMSDQVGEDEIWDTPQVDYLGDLFHRQGCLTLNKVAMVSRNRRSRIREKEENKVLYQSHVDGPEWVCISMRRRHKKGNKKSKWD